MSDQASNVSSWLFQKTHQDIILKNLERQQASPASIQPSGGPIDKMSRSYLLNRQNKYQFKQKESKNKDVRFKKCKENTGIDEDLIEKEFWEQ